MKKSTLITTIAMIVVVVVALSTATYAWFSASTVSTATVSMTTTATSDWMIFEGHGSATEVTNEKAYSFTSAAAETITLVDAGLQTGLKAPSSAAWANTLTVDGTQVNVTSQEFLTAKKAAGNVVKVDGVPTVYDPFVLKVSNATGADDKTLKITVVINAGESQSTGTLYAAAATTFDIAYITTKSGATVQKFTKGYTKSATKAEGTYANNDVVTAHTTAVDPNPAQFATGSSAIFTYANATAMNSSTGVYTNFKKVGSQATAEELAWGLTANQYYLAYSITIADIDKTDSVYQYLVIGQQRIYYRDIYNIDILL